MVTGNAEEAVGVGVGVGVGESPNLADIICELGLLSRILESLIKVGCPSRFKSFLSDF